MCCQTGAQVDFIEGVKFEQRLQEGEAMNEAVVLCTGPEVETYLGVQEQ